MLPLLTALPNVPGWKQSPHPLHLHSSWVHLSPAITVSHLSTNGLGVLELNHIHLCVPLWCLAQCVTHSQCAIHHIMRTRDMAYCSINKRNQGPAPVPPSLIKACLQLFVYKQGRKKAELIRSCSWDQDPKHMSAHMEGLVPKDREKNRFSKGKEEKTPLIKKKYCSHPTPGIPLTGASLTATGC